MSDLIPIEHINALQVFTEDGIDKLLSAIENEVREFEPDLSTPKSRGEIKSMAYKVTLSKGVIDRAGGDLVKESKARIKIVDDSRRKARTFLDELATEVRAPLTEYEAETARMQAEVEHKAMLTGAHDEALAEHNLWMRERILAEHNAKNKADEEERQRKELAEIKKKAEEDAARQAQEAEDARIKAAAEIARMEEKAEAERMIHAEQERAAKAEQDAKDAAEQAKRDAAAAVEQERLRGIREQAEKDAAAKQVAEAREKKEAERQANADHRRQVNQGALNALMECGFSEDAAKHFITVVFQGKIPGMRMVY